MIARAIILLAFLCLSAGPAAAQATMTRQSLQQLSLEDLARRLLGPGDHRVRAWEFDTWLMSMPVSLHTVTFRHPPQLIRPGLCVEQATVVSFTSPLTEETAGLRPRPRRSTSAGSIRNRAIG